MRFKLKEFFNHKKNKTTNEDILILDDIVEQDQKQFVQKNLEYFHLSYNLFQNTSYYFLKQTKNNLD